MVNYHYQYSKRPAAAEPRAEDAAWRKSGDLDTDTLLGWKWEQVKGRYWEEPIEVIGNIEEAQCQWQL